MMSSPAPLVRLTLVEKRRLDLKLDRKQLASAAGVHRMTVRSVEQRKARPTDETLFKLARVLGGSVAELRADLNGEEA